MLSISSGHSASYLTDQVAKGRESYYLDATTDGEPPGRWWGKGAEAFGLVGEVDHNQMHALYGEFRDPRDPRWHDPATRDQCATLGRAPAKYKTADEMFAERIAAEPNALPERIRQIRAECERAERQPVAFIDATFSPVKSVTVLHTAFARCELDARRAGDEAEARMWAGKRNAVEKAIWAGNNAMLAYLSDKAGYSRVGRHGAGAGRWTDAHNWTVASFFQHTNRDLDPQLHVHNACLNRVACPDGVVRTLDSRAIHELKQICGAIGERVMEEDLSASLGVQWARRLDGNGREIVGIDQQALDLFSERSVKIGRNLAGKIEEFRAHFGREPSAIERDRLRRQSAMATRRAKTHTGETKAQQLDRWEHALRGYVQGGLHRIAERFRTGEPVPAQTYSPSGIIAEAIAACQETQPVSDRSVIGRQITMRLPALGGMPKDQITELVDALTDQAIEQLVPVSGGQRPDPLPGELTLNNGRSVYASPSGPKYATHNHVVAEQALRRAAVQRGRLAVPADQAQQWMATTGPADMLGADQAAAVRGLLTSGTAMSVLVGPAGTGKSFTLGVLAQAWADLTGGRVLGLATSQIATEVLADDGVTAMNTARWLATQGRLAAGTGAPADQAWRLASRDMLVVDEASMVDTAVLEKIRTIVDQVGARMVLTGDPRQLAAVGAGGAMAMLADGVAETHTLAEVRRFTNGWERAASLALRAGDPQALDEYDRRGRLQDCGTAEQAIHAAARAWLGDTLAGKTSLVVVATNEEASAVAATIRDELVALGRVNPIGLILGRDGNIAGVGDLIQARKNDWPASVINMARYVVRQVHEDGSMVVRTEEGTETRTLSAAYVAEHVSLGYAATAHSAQGMTVDTAHCLASAKMILKHLYVALTRGREANTAYVVTHSEVAGEETGETHHRLRAAAGAVLAGILEREQEQERAVLVQAADAAREQGSLRTIAALFEDGVRDIVRQRTEKHLDQLTADGTLSAVERQLLAADQGSEQLARLLRAVEQAGHDPERALHDAVTQRSFDGAQSLAQVLHGRISDTYRGRLTPTEDAASSLPAGIPQDWRAYLAALGEQADTRRRELGTQVAEQPPQWAVEALGPVPDDVVDRAEWEHRAGAVAAYRETTGWDHASEAIGTSPGLSSTERRAGWHAAWQALGRPEATPEEYDLSDGALRNRVQAWRREQQWQPADVYAEQQATGAAIARHTQDAAILRAQADAATDAAEATRLRQEAADREAMTDVMTEVAAGLERVAEARVAWVVETALTQELAQRAEKELVNRCKPIDAEADRTTAQEWLQEHRAAMAAEDPYREVTEDDIRDDIEVDITPDTKVDMSTCQVDTAPDKQVDTGEAAQPDRTVDTPTVTELDAQVDSRPDKEMDMPAGVPSPVETAVAVAAAQLAVQELADRASAEQSHRATEQARQAEADQAAREQAWRTRDQAAERATEADLDEALSR